jgi:hypothetical protein
MSDDHMADHVQIYEWLNKLLGLETDKPQAQAVFGRFFVFTTGGAYLYIAPRDDHNDILWHNDDGISPVDQEMLEALRRHMILDELANV